MKWLLVKDKDYMLELAVLAVLAAVAVADEEQDLEKHTAKTKQGRQQD